MWSCAARSRFTLEENPEQGKDRAGPRMENVTERQKRSATFHGASRAEAYIRSAPQEQLSPTGLLVAQFETGTATFEPRRFYSLRLSQQLSNPEGSTRCASLSKQKERAETERTRADMATGHGSRAAQGLCRATFGDLEHNPLSPSGLRACGGGKQKTRFSRTSRQSSRWGIGRRGAWALAIPHRRTRASPT